MAQYVILPTRALLRPLKDWFVKEGVSLAIYQTFIWELVGLLCEDEFPELVRCQALSIKAAKRALENATDATLTTNMFTVMADIAEQLYYLMSQSELLVSRDNYVKTFIGIYDKMLPNYDLLFKVPLSLAYLGE